jgi:LPXTG-site transpeptidase (sortase) family protein
VPNHFVIPALEKKQKAKQKASRPTKLSMMGGAMMSAVQAAAFSLMIFGLGFFSLNASSYKEIIQASLIDASGVEQEHELEQFVEEEVVAEPEQKLLVVERTPTAQKSQIPDLNLAITPPDNRLIIPKIDKNIPLIDSDPNELAGADWRSLEKTFQKDLQDGVIHYPGTANPGEAGNVFITGHSSYYPWDPGRYKSVFARLKDLEVSDDVVIYHNQEKFQYRIIEKKEVQNDDISVLQQNRDGKFLTLMTCSPVGTNFKRLVIVAEQIQ